MIINKSKIFAISLFLSIINNSYAFIDEQQKMNKQIVTEFYKKAINQKILKQHQSTWEQIINNIILLPLMDLKV